MVWNTHAEKIVKWCSVWVFHDDDLAEDITIGGIENDVGNHYEAIIGGRCSFRTPD